VEAKMNASRRVPGLLPRKLFRRSSRRSVRKSALVSRMVIGRRIQPSMWSTIAFAAGMWVNPTPAARHAISLFSGIVLARRERLPRSQQHPRPQKPISAAAGAVVKRGAVLQGRLFVVVVTHRRGKHWQSLT